MKERRFPRSRVSGVRGKVSFAEYVEIIDMSVGGIAFKTERLLEIGREHSLIIEGGAFCMKLPAIAVWSKQTGVRRIDGESVPEYAVGFRFVEDLSPETQTLVGFIEPNKRAAVRFTVNARGRVRLDIDDPCEVKLISRSGMLIHAEQPLEVESVRLMEIIPPEQVPIRLNGRVASRIESTQGDVTSYDFGVEFVDMSEGNRRRLDVFIDSVSNQFRGT